MPKKMHASNEKVCPHGSPIQRVYSIEKLPANNETHAERWEKENRGRNKGSYCWPATSWEYTTTEIYRCIYMNMDMV
jgi:hypothetical protein